MKNYQHGPSGGSAPYFNYGRGDPPDRINNSNRVPSEAIRYSSKIWLTCYSSVCQNFVPLSDQLN